MPDQHHIDPETASAVRRCAAERLAARRGPREGPPTEVQIACMAAAFLARMAPRAPIEARVPPNLGAACDPHGVLTEHELCAVDAIYRGERAIARDDPSRPRLGPPRTRRRPPTCPTRAGAEYV